MNKKRVLRFLIQISGIALLIFIDNIIKNAVYENLRDEGTKVLIKGFLGLTYAENTGAAFSMFSSNTQVLSVITGVALLGALAVMFFLKEKPVIYSICVPLIIAGGAGNLIDRCTRGFVVDYIHTLFVNFPIFNFADCLITCACFALIIYLIYDMATENKRKNKPTEGDGND